MDASTSAADAPDGHASVPQEFVDLAHRLADAAASVTRRYFRHAMTPLVAPCTGSICKSNQGMHEGLACNC